MEDTDGDTTNRAETPMETTARETSGTTTMTTTVRTTVEDITAVETKPPADEADEPLATITLVKMDNKVDDTVSSTDVTAEDLPTDLTPEEDAPNTNKDLTPEEDMTNVDVEDAPSEEDALSEEDATSEDNPSSTKEDTRNGNAMEAITPEVRTFTIRHPRDFSVSTSL